MEDDVSTALDDAKSRIATLEDGIEKLKEAMTDVARNEAETVQKGSDETFNKVAARLDEMNARAEVLDARIGKIEFYLSNQLAAQTGTPNVQFST